MPRKKRDSSSSAGARPVLGEAALDPPPDPDAVAAEILGTPETPGAGPAPRSSTERVRAYRARKKGVAPEPEPAPEPAIEVTSHETAVMLSATWDLAVVPLCGKWRDGTPRMRALTEPQAERLGEAYAPLMKKWLPVLADWQGEIAALIVTLAIVRECANPKPREIFIDEIVDLTPAV